MFNTKLLGKGLSLVSIWNFRSDGASLNRRENSTMSEQQREKVLPSYRFSSQNELRQGFFQHFELHPETH